MGFSKIPLYPFFPFGKRGLRGILPGELLSALPTPIEQKLFNIPHLTNINIGINMGIKRRWLDGEDKYDWYS
jgi:hypothetical protein